MQFMQQRNCLSPTEASLPHDHPLVRTKVVLHPAAIAVAVAHAHLSRDEIIGFLAGIVLTSGHIDTLYVTEACPTKKLGPASMEQLGRNARYEVEMDAVDAVAVGTAVRGRRLRVLGWYHSHPGASMSAQPSDIDLETHFQQQAFMSNNSQFFGLIVAPRVSGKDPNPEFSFRVRSRRYAKARAAKSFSRMSS